MSDKEKKEESIKQLEKAVRDTSDPKLKEKIEKKMEYLNKPFAK